MVFMHATLMMCHYRIVLQSTSLYDMIVHVGYLGQGAHGKIMHAKILVC